MIRRARIGYHQLRLRALEASASLGLLSTQRRHRLQKGMARRLNALTLLGVEI